jgi:hypothetical protein
VIWGLGAALVWTALVWSQAAAPLRKYLRLAESDVAALRRGDVVSRSQAIDKRELTGFGAVRVSVTADEYALRFRDIVRFKRSEMVLQIGVMGREPSASDVAALTLDSSDVSGLRKCRVGDCDLRLTAPAIARLEREDRSARDFPERAARFVRDLLVEEARTYLTAGGGALPAYVDNEQPRDRLEAFRTMLRPSPFLLEYQPELFRYLEQYPREPLAGVDDLIYWSREKFGLKPVISLTHLVIYRPSGRQGVVFTATRQIYASHYFDASLGISALVEASADPSDRYLLYANRSRLDTFGGIFGPLARAIAQRRIRESMAENVRQTKERLEHWGALDRLE